jgi:hypothetical protein
MSTASATRFPDKNELKRFARYFLKERLDSLQKDVIHCLQQPYAPFPAILYCLSTIDLLGALNAGQASKKDPKTNKHVDTTANSKQYMRQYMGYTDDQINILVDLFRHKLVHLAQPRPCISYNNKVVVWEYVHNYTTKHLLLEEAPPNSKIQIKSDWSISVQQIFTIGIMQLKDDIQDSVYRHRGYLDLFERNTSNLQDMFEKAIEEIYQYW